MGTFLWATKYSIANYGFLSLVGIFRIDEQLWFVFDFQTREPFIVGLDADFL